MYLNVTTSYNLLNSTIRVEQLVEFLKEQAVNGCAIMNPQLYGVLDFKNQLEKEGLQPTIGLRANVEVNQGSSLPVLLYAMNKDGYDNLVKLSSAIMNTSNERATMKWLAAYKENIFAVIPGTESNWPKASSVVTTLKSIYDTKLLMGIARTGGIHHIAENDLITIAAENELPIVALHESYYLKPEGAFAYETLQAINNSEPLKSLQATNAQYYLPTVEELKQWFLDKPQWLNNAQSILTSCKVEFPPYKAHMPDYPLTNGENPADCLKRLATAGLKIRLNGNVSEAYEIPSEYKERLDYELNVINSMGYPSYFLIVADYMAFTRREGILTGPGRGSSASSLVAYALRITEVDPIIYGLLFERFLNPNRVSLPDIDIDFIDSRRHEVIQYLNRKYGKDHVAQILTYGNLTMKAAGRDVGRMLNFSPSELREVSTILGRTRKDTLMEAYTASSTVQTFVNSSERNKIWFKTACELEGLPRNTSTHAAGVVLTPNSLVSYLPVQKGNDGVYLTQWPMNEVEANGVLKVDILGLRNLSIIEEVLISLKKTYGVNPTLETIPLDDSETFNMLQQGYVEGIFQLESDGMRQSLVSIVPTTINDIIAINALYRPGPMEFIKDYAARKHGKEDVFYPHPSVKPILEETYGIIIYQEQIMKLAQVFAGFTLAEADLLRRAISKKKREVLEHQQKLFVQGAVNQGHDVETAEQTYSLIVKFAEYGFAKSHSTAYSLITYQMAFLKANYPSHFYSALLNNAKGNVEKTRRIMLEIKQRGIQLLPIDLLKSQQVNASEDKKIRLGFNNVIGLVKNKLEPFIQQVEGDFFAYAKTVGERFDTDVAERLIKAGAFDQYFAVDRNTLLASLTAADTHAKANEFFDFGLPDAKYEKATSPKSDSEYEIEVMGFTLQEHPVAKKRPDFMKDTFATMTPGDYIKTIVQVESAKETVTKKDEKMAFVSSSDESGNASLTFFPLQYSNIQEPLQQGQLMVIEGVVEEKYGKKSIVVKKFRIMD